MQNKSLNIVKEDAGSTYTQPQLTQQKILRNQIEAKFERQWMQNPEQFNPERNCMSLENFNRSRQMVQQALPLQDIHAVDLGAGYGKMSVHLSQAGAQKIDAVDIASYALKHIEEQNIAQVHTHHDFVPYTHLEDNLYDLVVCTELIAELPENEHRLFFSELCRLVKQNGKVVCSTSLDIYSENPLEKFHQLAETELITDPWLLSYHYLYIKFVYFFETPKRWILAKQERNQILQGKKGFARAWIDWNTKPPLSWLWNGLKIIYYPFLYILKKNRFLLLLLEKISKFIWGQKAISHAIFIGKKRPLFTPPPQDQIPKLPKQKRSVWE